MSIRSEAGGPDRDRRGAPGVDEPDISLVVSTLGRVPELRRLIRSLGAELAAGDGDAPSVELIVVDQSPDGRCLPVLRSLGDDAPRGLRWCHIRSALGVSRGRNLGMAVARGRLIMFPDDDAWFDGDTLVRAAAHLDEHPDHDGLCTQLRDGNGSPSMLRWAATSRRVTKLNHHRTSIGSTMLFRTTVARAAGGFDEAMGPGAGGWYGSCEDADFLLRVIGGGGRVWYDPDVVMNHRDSRRDGGPTAQAKSLAYGCGQGHLWRKHRFPVWLIVGLAVRRLIGGTLWSLRGRRDIGRAHRAWVRGSVNGWLGRPPLDLSTEGPSDVVESHAGSDPPTAREFRRSLSWRLAIAPLGAVATFALTTIVARNLPPAEVTITYTLLAALMIGPILGRFGLNQWAVRDLAALRTQEAASVVAALAKRYGLAVVAPAAVAAPLISVLFIAGAAHGSVDVRLAALSATILFAETWRLAIGDVLIALGRTGWAAALAHQVRAVAVTSVVVAHLAIWPRRFDLDLLLQLMAAVSVLLCGVGLLRLYTLSGRSIERSSRFDPLAVVRRGLPFLIVDLVVVVVARGDVWLAAPSLPDDVAARYGTASVVAAQIGIPIGLASVALAPMVAGLVAQRRFDAIERMVRSLATLIAYVLVPLVAIVVLRGRPLLELAYGTPYGGSHPYLLVLMVGNLALALLGAGPAVLLMSGRHWEAAAVAAGCLAVAAPAAVAAAWIGGAMPLAVVSASTTVGLYGLLAFATWITTGIRLVPYAHPGRLGLVGRHADGGLRSSSSPSVDVLRRGAP